MSHEKLKDHVTLGDEKLLRDFFQTTTGSTYCHPDTSPKLRVRNLSFLQSNLPEGTGGECGLPILRAPPHPQSPPWFLEALSVTESLTSPKTGPFLTPRPSPRPLLQL